MGILVKQAGIVFTRHEFFVTSKKMMQAILITFERSFTIESFYRKV